MVDWDAFTDSEVQAFAGVILSVGRELTRSVPAPRGAPLFGLDMSMADPTWLDRFSRHGIFRKYQRAVAFDSGFGGVARWWALHFGCRVTSIDPHAGLSAAAQTLAVASGAGERTTYKSAPLHNLPFGAEQFTHVWSVAGLAALADPSPALREAMRVLRPSGMLSAIIDGRTAEDPAVAGWVDAVDVAGFIAIAVRPLPTPELPYTVFYAEHVLRTAIATTFEGEPGARLLALARQLDAARSSRAPRVIVFAEKPS
jgi:ubiquinone/menaquinone biosynthesis C-methylase UbiE